MTKYIVVDREESNYKGYANYCVALAEKLGMEIITIEQALDLVPEEIGMIISAGEMGVEVAEALVPILPNPEDYEFILMTDRMVDLEVFKHFGGLVFVAPSFVLPKITAVYPEAISIAGDLAPAPSSSRMKELAKDFETKNPEAAQIIASACVFGFIGGRVQIPGGWKEISVEIFEQTAEKLMESSSGNDMFLVLHGLRGVTRGNGETYLEPSEALCDKVQELLGDFQTVSVLTAEATEDGKRKAVLKVIDADGIRSIDVDNTGASGYYYGIAQAIEADAWLNFSAEQMNFTKEALNMGANFSDINPFGEEMGWTLTVESNLRTHEVVRNTVFKGLPIETLDEALVRHLSY